MIKILDCTLRDGGYVNNWEFGRLTKQSILSHLCEGKIDIIECGFVSQTKNCTPSNSLYRYPHDIRVESGSSEYSVMVNHGEYVIEEMEDKSENQIDIIRYAFHKKDYVDAIEACGKLIQKGYKVFLQPMNTSNYSKEEYEDMIKRANRLDISAFYIVDSFGNMKKQDVKRFFTLVSVFLKDGVPVGFHSHNNLQLSFSNSQTLIGMCSDRDLIIDSTLFGMGRGAGNLCTELIAQYLNDEHEGHYNLIPILESVEADVLPIRRENEWGYSIPYYIASINDCHPNYASYLVFKHTLSVKEINNIILSIPFAKRQNYDEQYIARIYAEHQSEKQAIKSGKSLLEEAIAGRPVLIVGPGKTIATEKAKVLDYVKSASPVVISINGEIPYLTSDYVFVSNKNRFDKLQGGDNFITTSNIDCHQGIRIHYGDLLLNSPLLLDNAGLMCVKLLSSCSPSSIALAGFDGYSIHDNDDYFDKKYKFSKNHELTQPINEEMTAILSGLIEKSPCEIFFLTTSLYDTKKK